MALTALLLIAAAPNVAVEPAPDGRFRVSTVIAGDSGMPEDYARGLLRLRAAAEEQCRGRGRAISSGTIEADRVPHRPDRLSLAETYACERP